MCRKSTRFWIKVTASSIPRRRHWWSHRALWWSLPSHETHKTCKTTHFLKVVGKVPKQTHECHVVISVVMLMDSPPISTIADVWRCLELRREIIAIFRRSFWGAIFSGIFLVTIMHNYKLLEVGPCICMNYEVRKTWFSYYRSNLHFSYWNLPTTWKVTQNRKGLAFPGEN